MLGATPGYNKTMEAVRIRDVTRYIDPDQPNRFVLGLNAGDEPVYLHYRRSRARSRPTRLKNIITQYSHRALMTNFIAAQLLIKGHGVVATGQVETPLSLCMQGQAPNPVPAYFRRHTPSQQRPYFEDTPAQCHMRLEILTTPRSFWQSLPLIGSRPWPAGLFRGITFAITTTFRRDCCGTRRSWAFLRVPTLSFAGFSADFSSGKSNKMSIRSCAPI